MGAELILFVGAAFLSGFCAAFFLQQKKVARLAEAEKQERESLVKENAASAARAEELQKRIDEQKREFEEASEKTFSRFQELSHKMLDENTEKLRERSEKSISTVLDPLKEKLGQFEKKITEVYSSEARERFALGQEIKRTAEINMKMSAEASSLTRALKGDIKAQGNWGEVILERILEASGLREGEEYTLQAKEMKLKDSDGKSLRPDAVINLPDDKHIIIDSKISLLSFESLSNAEDENNRSAHLKAFFDSVDAHVRGLSSKHYSGAKGVNSPEFVFLFMPIEAAFLTYAKENQSGFSSAWEKRVMIVGPSTLWPCLTTVANLWKSERQNRNAIKIAEYAGSLYDKFAGFMEDMDRVGKNLGTAQQSLDDAVGKLKSGKGNLLRQTERLKELGAKARKQLELDP